MKKVLHLIVGILLFCNQGVWSQIPAGFTKIIFSGAVKDMDDFESFAKRAKASGATHIEITSQPYPCSYWQYDTPGDPYPSWAINLFTLFKVATPEALKSYIPQDYAEKVMQLLESRCRILRKYGLKAYVKADEPHMLPEKVYTDHPLWRGPRVDQPSRSRVARFAPSIDNPEVLELYRESVSKLMRRCPEIDIMSVLTNDSGGGLDWSNGLYSGSFGNTIYKNRRMDQRLRDFFAALQKGAQDAGVTFEIDMILTREEDPERVAHFLGKGMAIENLEGPDATPYKTGVGSTWADDNVFYPVLGVPTDLIAFQKGLETVKKSKAPRMIIGILDRFNRDLYFRIFDQFWKNPTHNETSRLAFLVNLAAQEVGQSAADDLVALWRALYESENYHRIFDHGGSMFLLGTIHQRWITRPLVPFPGELLPTEKDYYRKFLFQARSEEHADNLVDLQANLRLASWAGRDNLSFAILSRVRSCISEAQRLLTDLLPKLSKEKLESYKILEIRLQAVQCLITNAENIIDYQAQLDRVRRLKIEPESTPVIKTPSGWDRQMMLETARRELDNTAVLMKLLQSTKEQLIDLAPVKAEESVIMLGPDLQDQLQKKLNIMNSKWMDYDRIFTRPNM